MHDPLPRIAHFLLSVTPSPGKVGDIKLTGLGIQTWGLALLCKPTCFFGWLNAFFISQGVDSNLPFIGTRQARILPYQDQQPPWFALGHQRPPSMALGQCGATGQSQESGAAERRSKVSEVEEGALTLVGSGD